MTPCTLCGKPTAFQGADMCNSCWEVDQRIDLFVRSKAGAERVRRALLESGPTEELAR